jgi:CRP-like cAMP-binding protein
MSSNEVFAKSLSHSQLFHGIETPALLELVQLGQIQHSKPGQVLIQEEDRVPGLFVILAGAAHVVKSSQKLTTLGRGAFFGEISLFGVSLGATASIIVGNDPCDYLIITASALDQWAKKHPTAERAFLKKMCVELSRRLYATSERL